jgi:hypothetical protein
MQMLFAVRQGVAANSATRYRRASRAVVTGKRNGVLACCRPSPSSSPTRQGHPRLRRAMGQRPLDSISRCGGRERSRWRNPSRKAASGLSAFSGFFGVPDFASRISRPADRIDRHDQSETGYRSQSEPDFFAGTSHVPTFSRLDVSPGRSCQRPRGIDFNLISTPLSRLVVSNPQAQS